MKTKSSSNKTQKTSLIHRTLNKGWIAVLALTIIVTLLTQGCKKEKLHNNVEMNIDRIEQSNSNDLIRLPFKIVIKMHFAKGKRKTNDPNTESPCDGRSICFIGPVITIESNWIVYSGGGVQQGYKDVSSGLINASISKSDDGYTFYVERNQVTPEDFDEIFKNSQYEMEDDYYFPKWVSDELNINEQIILKKGIYPTIITNEGASFNF